MASIFDTLGGLFGMETDAMREEEEARNRATELWDQQLANAPGAYGLAGFNMFGQPSNQFTEQYMLANPDATPQQVQEAWAQRTFASNPLYGLDVARQSQLAGVNADPASVQAQQRALSRLEGISDAGGYTDAERAQMANIQRDAGNIARSNRLAAQSQAEARGMGRGGASLAGALMAQQGGANQAAANANQTAISAQQRALQAIEAGGALSGQMRGQGFQEASQRASAADAWNRGNSNMIMQRQQMLAGGQQQQAANQLANTQGATGQYNQNAQAAQQDQDQMFNQLQQVGQTVGSFYGGGGR